jgi:hypothetical protein
MVHNETCQVGMNITRCIGGTTRGVGDTNSHVGAVCTLKAAAETFLLKADSCQVEPKTYSSSSGTAGKEEKGAKIASD